MLAYFAIVAGLGLLIWSSDRFIEGAAVTSKYLGMSPFIAAPIS